jgi:hypothetical protein
MYTSIVIRLYARTPAHLPTSMYLPHHMYQPTHLPIYLPARQTTYLTTFPEFARSNASLVTIP